MPRDNTWTNQDGLVVGFGTHSVDNNVLAVTSERGAIKTATVVLSGVGLEVAGTVTAASNPPPQAIKLRRGAILLSANLLVIEAFSTGSSPTLTIGTFKAGDVSTANADDADGIDATIAASALGLGARVDCNGALVGATYKAGVAGVGATSDSDVDIVASYGTAPFTAGKAVLTLEYIEPTYVDTVAN